ncbi:unnamed protein product [Bursaphelenchus xylophilus]|uniref:(pine wood nematode) hypothetical protein n=1 Tax=Bursaphelenchus xylophilus TaxID=6326 RepID=A0A1I7RX76_BURXY|nr:unnamed protein product [Bursaphelenchus xylophilus]CAG9121395.1 unnamed protein product [Bursaphelenchus xylophilus]
MCERKPWPSTVHDYTCDFFDKVFGKAAPTYYQFEDRVKKVKEDALGRENDVEEKVEDTPEQSTDQVEENEKQPTEKSDDSEDATEETTENADDQPENVAKPA